MRKIKLLLLGVAAVATIPAPVAAQTAPPVIAPQGLDEERPVRQELIMLKTDDGRMVPTLITFPRGGINPNAPAIIHCQGGPGASPLDGSGPWIAQGMATNGYLVIAPMIRHGEELFDADFTDFNFDVKAAVDYLDNMGFSQIVLTGSSFGSIPSSHYIVDTQDPRITANIHFAPTEDLGYFTQRGMGDAEFWKQTKEAGLMIAADKKNRVFAPEFNAPPPMPPGTRTAFAANPQLWMNMWGPASNGINIQLFPKIKLPILMLAGEKDGFNSIERMERLKAAATASPQVDILYYPGEVDHSFNSNPPTHPQVIHDVTAWLEKIGHSARGRVKTEIFTINDREPGTRAVRYVPDAGVSGGTAFLTLHDYDGSAMAGPANFLAERAAQGGNFAIGIHSMRGSRGMLAANYAGSSKDIGAWVDYLEKHGFTRVILVGHGIGATRAADYIRTRKDKRVVGLVAAAPAPDSAAALKAAVGTAAYDQAYSQAVAKKGSTDYRDYVYFDNIPATLPSNIGKNTLALTPDGFLSSWGPDAPAMSRMVGTLGVPVLLLAGRDDARIDLATLGNWSKAKGVTLKVYPTDHGFEAAEFAAGEDMMAWATSAGLISAERRQPPRQSVGGSAPTEAVPEGPHGAGVAGLPEQAG